jgi:hypothetical protein
MRWSQDNRVCNKGKMKKKSLLPAISILFLLTAGLYILWPLFVPVPTPEQAIHLSKIYEEKRLKMESDEEAKLLETGSLPVLRVSEIVEIPNKYDKKLVRLRGCVLSGFETFVLMECTLTPENKDNRIWLESSMGFILFTEKVTEKRQHWRIPRPQTKSEAAMLESLYKTENRFTPATIEGEFQSCDGPYGHLGSCKYRLIVHRVIKVSNPKEIGNRP